MPERRLVASVLRIAAIGSLLALGSVAAVGSDATASGASLVGYGSSGGNAHVIGATTGAFSIAGSATGLFPGRKLPLVLKVKNPQTFAITVTSITTAVANASSQCVAANVTVTSFSGQLVVAAGKTAKVTVHVKMIRSAPDACNGAIFPFQYTGLATAP